MSGKYTIVPSKNVWVRIPRYTIRSCRFSRSIWACFLVDRCEFGRSRRFKTRVIWLPGMYVCLLVIPIPMILMWKTPLKNESKPRLSKSSDSPTKLLDLFKVLADFLPWGIIIKPPFGDFILPSTLSKSKKKITWTPPTKRQNNWKDLVQMRMTSANTNQGSSHAVCKWLITIHT